MSDSVNDEKMATLRGLPSLVTIGVYGSDEAGFFFALQQAGVVSFGDIRARRGVRCAA